MQSITCGEVFFLFFLSNMQATMFLRPHHILAKPRLTFSWESQEMCWRETTSAHDCHLLPLHKVTLSSAV